MNGLPDSKAKKVAIIGAGAAGMMAACQLGLEPGEVLLIEKNRRGGEKLRITGKGRCNLTNNCTTQQMLANILSNPKFLYGSASLFTPQDTMSFFENLGVKLKTERGGRVFPVSDSAHEIADALAAEAEKHSTKLTADVTKIEKTADGFEISCAGGKTVRAERVLLATGGKSYPMTGSDGAGYALANHLGHTIEAPSASLVPICCADDLNDCRDLLGLSLKNVTLSLLLEGMSRPLYREQGEMLFTHFGVSGPLVLSASAHVRKAGAGDRETLNRLITERKLTLSLDLKPALDEKKLDARLLRDFSENLNREFKNSLSKLLPSKLIPVIVKRSGIPADRRVNSVTAEQRAALAGLLKDFRFKVTGTRPVSEAVITAGGVKTSEINPKTMESKRCPGLFFAGEVIDVDAYTGGYNLQIAFCTAVSAARSIIAQIKETKSKTGGQDE